MAQPPLNLSSEHVLAWWNHFPMDLRAAIRNDAKPDGDAALMEVVRDLESAPARRFLDVMSLHADSVEAMGRTRRLRLMSWLVGRCWPDTNLARDLMRGLDTEDDDEGGESRGRSKVAPLFRSDYEALAAFCGRRQVRGARSLDTVEALHNGIQGFDQSAGM